MNSPHTGTRARNNTCINTFINALLCYLIWIKLDCFTVRRLLMQGVSPDSTNEDGLTALHQVHLRLLLSCYCFDHSGNCWFPFPFKVYNGITINNNRRRKRRLWQLWRRRWTGLRRTMPAAELDCAVRRFCTSKTKRRLISSSWHHLTIMCTTLTPPENYISA